MKTVCYLRVSSPKRANGQSRQSNASQKLALKNYCKIRAFKSPLTIEDHATGRNQERKGFNELMDLCRTGQCQRIIIWKLDRLGRSAVETIKTIQELMTLGIEVHVTTQGLTFDKSAYSTFLVQLFAALAELESNHASERIRAGLAVAREKGTKLGRKPSDAKRRKIEKWTKQGLSLKEQAKRLGVSVAAVSAMRKRAGIAA